MPQYLSPGVYIEELDVGPHPIQGVSTSTTGMVGVTVRGPTDGKPRLVTTFNDYQRIFGGFLPVPDDPGILSTWGDPANGGAWWLFPLAVKGFFDNGGQQLYVKRVFAADKSPTLRGATSATAAFMGGLFADVTKAAPKGATQITVSHLVGISAGTQITIRYRDPALPPHDQAVAVDAYDSATKTLTLHAGLDQDLHPASDQVQIKAANNTGTLTFTAISRGSWGKGIGVRTTPVVTTLGLLPDPGEGAPFTTQLTALAAQDSTTVEVTAVPGLDPTTPPHPFLVQIGPRRFRVTDVAQAQAGQPSPLTLTLEAEGGGAPQHRSWPVGFGVRRVRHVNLAAGPALHVAGARRLYPNAIVELEHGNAKQTLQVTSVQGDLVTFTADANDGYLEGDQLYLVEMQIAISYDPGTGAPITETFTNLRLDGQDPGGAPARINGRSQLVTVTQAASLVSPGDLRLPATSQGPGLSLTGGEDNFGSLTVGDFVGIDGGSGHRTGIQALEDIDEIAICAVPGIWSQTVQSSLIDHCELLRDRFAILDPPDGEDIDGIGAFREVFDTEYAALYYPWCVTVDPSTGSNVHVPPSGLLAGIYADTDVNRGVHKAPANVVIRGINLVGGLAADVTKREQDVLNPVGINALRFFPGLGERVWGARTLSSNTDWKYINVRRLFIFVEKSIFNGTQWVVFEPNNEQLWALVRQSITAFLTTVWQTGALAGTTQDQAFFVRCDRTTMSQDDLDNGRLICIIGLAPVFPAEFVIFRFEQKTADSQQS
jgi:Bacteriophage tail sheath protein